MCSYWHVEYTFDNLLIQKQTDKKPKNFRSMSEKGKSYFRRFFLRVFFQSVPVSKLNSVLAALLEVLRRKKRKLFAQCPEMINTLDSSFWRPCWKISDWITKRVSSVCEKDKIFSFQKKFSNWFNGRVESSFQNSVGKKFDRRLKVFGHFWKQ